MPMVMFMMANGKMIKQMAMVNTLIQTEQHMREVGKKISSMARDKNTGLMELSTQEIT